MTQTFFRPSRLVAAIILAVALLLALTQTAASVGPTYALQEEVTPTPTETASPTATPTLTSTPTSPPPSASDRPLVVVSSYATGSGGVRPGSEFSLSFRLENAGQAKARNILVSFAAGDVSPIGNGGVIAAGVLAPGASTGYTQRMMASGSVAVGSVASVAVTAAYTDDEGTAYTESFSLSIPIVRGSSSGSPRPGATPTPLPGPQLLIRAYSASEPVLVPGTRFSLELDVFNVGGSAAKRITMILGGGTGGTDPDKENPDTGSGGLSAGGGDFANFAPMGMSNVQFLGDLPAGTSLSARQALIVNSGTKPGAYAVRISFTYTDEKGKSMLEDQVITLLVTVSPRVEISFYRPMEALLASQPNPLPIQVVNVDRSAMVLGRVHAAADGAAVENASALVGYLDPGGYFSFEPMLIPDRPGVLELALTVEYLDDFNQPQQLTEILKLEVVDGPAVEPEGEGGPGMAPEPAQESFWGRLGRAVRGLVGLDSGPPAAPTGPEGPGGGPPQEQYGPVGPAG